MAFNLQNAYKDGLLVKENLALSLIWGYLMALSRKMASNVKPREQETFSGPVV